jgi:hypothetical protein
VKKTNIWALTLLLASTLLISCSTSTQTVRQPVASLPEGNRLMSVPRLGGTVGYRQFGMSSIAKYRQFAGRCGNDTPLAIAECHNCAEICSLVAIECVRSGKTVFSAPGYTKPTPNFSGILESSDLRVQPLVSVLQATLKSDVTLFKSSFSCEVARKQTEPQFQKALDTYRTQFQKEFGNYDVSEFRFKFTGNEEVGNVVIIHNGREAFKGEGLDVVKEEGGWKINKR